MVFNDFILIHGFFGGGPSGREGIRVLEECIFNAVELGREGRTLLRDWVSLGPTASFAMARLLFDRLYFYWNLLCWRIGLSINRWAHFFQFMNLHNYASPKILHYWPSYRISSTHIRMKYMPKRMYCTIKIWKILCMRLISNIHVQHRNLRSSSGGYF